MSGLSLGGRVHGPRGLLALALSVAGLGAFPAPGRAESDLPPQGTRPSAASLQARVDEAERRQAEAEQGLQACMAGTNPRACLRDSIAVNRAKDDLERARADQANPPAAPAPQAPAPPASPAIRLEAAQDSVRRAGERKAEADAALATCEAGGNPRACLGPSIQRNRANDELERARDEESRVRSETGTGRRSEAESENQVAESGEPKPVEDKPATVASTEPEPATGTGAQTPTELVPTKVASEEEAVPPASAGPVTAENTETTEPTGNQEPVKVAENQPTTMDG